MEGRARIPLAGAILAALPLLPAPAAAAPDSGPPGDPVETERRLAAAGVGPALRLRVHGAVERGAAFLASLVDGSGRIVRADGASLALGDPVAMDALCVLALVHAGTKATRDATGRAATRILRPDGSLPRELLASPAAMGMAALIGHARGIDPAAAGALGDALADSQDADTGWWRAPVFVRVRGPGLPTAPPLPATFLADVDATCWAALGLAAADARAARSHPAAWRRLADGLARRQAADGAWAFTVAGGTTDPGSGAQGFCALALAARALAEPGVAPSDLKARVRECLDRARGTLLEDAADGLWLCGRTPQGSFDRSLFLLHFANALVHADGAPVDGADWFPPLAEALLAGQRDDGGWPGRPWAPGTEPVATAAALLALVRAGETLVPGAGAGDAGAPADPPPWPDPGATPPSARVPIREAEEGLDWLLRLLDDPAGRAASLETALRFVGRAYGNLEPGDRGEPPPGEAAWRRRAENALLRASAVDGRQGARSIRRLAARLLGFTGPAVAARFRRVLEERWPRAKAPAPDREEWRAAFGALARVGDEDSFDWIAEEALSTDDDGPRRDRGLEALRALGAVRDVAGRLRRRAAERVALSESRRESDALAAGSAAAQHPLARVRWAASRRWTIDTLHALCRDPVTGAAAADASGAPLLRLVEFRSWIADRSRLRDPPWRDR